jgi:hypothetical protein
LDGFSVSRFLENDKHPVFVKNWVFCCVGDGHFSEAGYGVYARALGAALVGLE